MRYTHRVSFTKNFVSGGLKGETFDDSCRCPTEGSALGYARMLTSLENNKKSLRSFGSSYIPSNIFLEAI